MARSNEWPDGLARWVFDSYRRCLIAATSGVVLSVIILLSITTDGRAIPGDYLSPKGRVTNLPVPRYVTLGASRARMRVGPGVKYRIRWVYLREGIPLEVIAEFGNWRKVRDHLGDVGWMYHALLSGGRSAIVAPWQSLTAEMQHQRSDRSRTIANLQPGVVVSLEYCDGSWCRAGTEEPEVAGYVRQEDLWGVYPGELIE